MLTTMTRTVEVETATPWGVVTETAEETYTTGLPVTLETAYAMRAGNLLARAKALAEARNSRAGKIAAAIAAAVNNASCWTHPAEVRTSVGNGRGGELHGYVELYIGNHRAGGWYDLSEEYSKTSSWRSRPTGRWAVVVEEETMRYNRYVGRNVQAWKKCRFPQKKDGGHNYGAIARLLIARVNRAETKAATEARIEANRASVPALQAELGLKDYGSATVGASADAAKPVFVKLEVSRAMTVEDARNLINAIRTVIPEYGK